ncbi:hypothetical protein ES703_36773 [subsurface metagenome]
MRVFIGKSYKNLNVYTLEAHERTDHRNRTYTQHSTHYLANLRVDHDLRENTVLKYLENSRITSLGKGRDGHFEIEIDNEENLKKIEHMLQVSLIHTEVKGILRRYTEGEMTLDDAYTQLLPYVVAKSLIPKS